MNNMLKRVFSAIIGISLCVFALFFNKITRITLLVVIAVIAVFEMSKALKNKNINCLKYILIIYVIGFTVLELLELGNTFNLCLLILCFIPMLLFGFKNSKFSYEVIIYSFFMFIYPVAPCCLLISVGTKENGLFLIVFTFVASWLCDCFAQIGGILFGKHKLIPDISPKKTIEGCIAGLMSFVVSGTIMYFSAKYTFKIQLPLYISYIAAFACSIFGQIGDLTASYFKRYTGVKDFGNLIPGHGGVLDRFDSIILSLPITYFIITMTHII